MRLSYKILNTIYLHLEPTSGFEPETCRLRIGCSTTKLRWRAEKTAILDRFSWIVKRGHHHLLLRSFWRDDPIQMRKPYASQCILALTASAAHTRFALPVFLYCIDSPTHNSELGTRNHYFLWTSSTPKIRNTIPSNRSGSKGTLLRPNQPNASVR